MKKLESLKKLLEVVKQQDTLASGDYCSGGTNCVIGHLLKVGGVTDKQLKEMDRGKYDAYEADYAIGSILNAIVENNLKGDFVKESLETLGFDLSNDRELLKTLQRRNDNLGLTQTIVLLKEIIAEMESIND